MEDAPWVRAMKMLAVCCLIALGLSHFALTDIARGGENLAAEWFTLQVTFLLLVTFIASSLWVISRDRG